MMIAKNKKKIKRKKIGKGKKRKKRKRITAKGWGKKGVGGGKKRKLVGKKCKKARGRGKRRGIGGGETQEEINASGGNRRFADDVSVAKFSGRQVNGSIKRVSSAKKEIGLIKVKKIVGKMLKRIKRIERGLSLLRNKVKSFPLKRKSGIKIDYPPTMKKKKKRMAMVNPSSRSPRRLGGRGKASDDGEKAKLSGLPNVAAAAIVTRKLPPPPPSSLVVLPNDVETSRRSGPSLANGTFSLIELNYP